jgi:ribosomal 50S subunit-recycling heat shock protein
MRLDKFLKLSSLAKRRSVAKEALDAGRVEHDGRAAKPSYNVKIGDVLTIHYATRELCVRVTALPEPAGARVAGRDMYAIISDLPTQ